MTTRQFQNCSLFCLRLFSKEIASFVRHSISKVQHLHRIHRNQTPDTASVIQPLQLESNEILQNLKHLKNLSELLHASASFRANGEKMENLRKPKKKLQNCNTLHNIVHSLETFLLVKALTLSSHVRHNIQISPVALT